MIEGVSVTERHLNIEGEIVAGQNTAHGALVVVVVSHILRLESPALCVLDSVEPNGQFLTES